MRGIPPRTLLAEMNMIEDSLHPLKASYFRPVPLPEGRDIQTSSKHEFPHAVEGRDVETEVINLGYGMETLGYTELLNGSSSGRRTPEVDRETTGTTPAEDETQDSDGEGSFKDSDSSRKQNDKKVYNCQHCKYVTDRKNNLKRHVVTMHDTCPKVLECCDHMFKNKASLREHVMSCHKNGYDCRICGRNFCRKALLKRHVTVHSGQKDYICNICGYATSHKSNLDRHKRRHDTKYQCEELQTHVNPNKTFDIMRFLPSGFSCAPRSNLNEAAYVTSQLSPPPLSPQQLSPALLPPLPPFHGALYMPIYEDTAITRPYWTVKHRQRSGKTLFTKRIVATHNGREEPRPSGTPGTPSQVEQTVLDLSTGSQKHTSPSKQDMAPVQDNGSQRKVKGVVVRLPSIDSKHGKDTEEMTSIKRLVPRLYDCRDCGLVFATQLEFNVHQDKVHSSPVGLTAPQRPLTIQARPVRWFAF